MNSDLGAEFELITCQGFLVFSFNSSVNQFFGEQDFSSSQKGGRTNGPIGQTSKARRTNGPSTKRRRRPKMLGQAEQLIQLIKLILCIPE